MDVLKAEIAKKRKQLEEKNLIGPTKKYFKREELLKSLQEDYWIKHKERHKDDETEECGRNENDADSQKDNQEDRTLPRKEVIKRLRERNEPILLYGENEAESFQRLRRLEILEPEVDRSFRNDFQEALEKVDQAYLDEILKTQGKTNDGKSVNDVKFEEESTTLEEIKSMTNDFGKGNVSHDVKVILTFLKFILHLWGTKLNSRSENEKICMKGKLASATYNQTQSYIGPLFKRLKNKTVPEDILEYLVDIVKNMLDRDYVKANDTYLQMAIGNAPWPIGVTMVGIHARTGREKIFSRNIAHVLNDETQRKFIQALKRMMTQCQRLFPTDPSRSVEYNA